jgi:hypothetical protein
MERFCLEYKMQNLNACAFKSNNSAPGITTFGFVALTLVAFTRVGFFVFFVSFASFVSSVSSVSFVSSGSSGFSGFFAVTIALPFSIELKSVYTSASVV